MGSVGCLPIFKEFLARKPRYNPIEFVGRGMVKPLRQEALVFKLLVWWVELLLYISQVFFLPDQEFCRGRNIFLRYGWPSEAYQPVCSRGARALEIGFLRRL